MEQEKIIRYWLEQLEEPYRSQSLKNVEARGGYWNNRIFVSLSEAIKGLFIWHDSPEGFDYWNSKYDQLKGVIIKRNPDSVIKFKKDPIFFRVNQSKLDDQVKLSNQLNLFCKRYFADMDGNLDIIMGYNGTDFADNKITILIRSKNNIDKSKK